MTKGKKKKVWRDIKLSLYDRFGWFRKEHESEFYNRGLFNYLLDHPEYITGKVGVSQFKGLSFWNTHGKEFDNVYPTVYFPTEWIENLKEQL